MLGQVGKARESEAKSTIGALNRAQQAYYTEKASFVASDINMLEVPVNTSDTSNKNYYRYSVGAAGVQLAKGISRDTNGTKDYAGGVAYNTTDRTFSAVVCRNKSATDNITTDAVTGNDAGAGKVAGCVTSTAETIR
jgi:type IV pilus assembly protein PilA